MPCPESLCIPPDRCGAPIVDVATNTRHTCSGSPHYGEHSCPCGFAFPAESVAAPSTPDLAARILAAIERVELAAGAATAGPWRHNPNKHWRKPGTCWYEEAVFTGPAGADATCVAGTGPSDHPQAMADARHIALNDPKTVLLRCAADRELIAEARSWENDFRSCLAIDPSDREEPGRGCYCAVNACRARIVQRLAAAYGITVEAP